MSRLSDLLRRASSLDAQLGADLEAEYRVLSDRLSFGLNFERHQPEAVEQPGRPVRRGDKVRILLPRGTKRQGDQRLWRVTGMERDGDVRIASLSLLGVEEPEVATVDAADLVVVAEFRDPIYPGLVSTDRVERGGDKPYSAVINAENFHALQSLLYTHRGKVDCIYIDPPYNTLDKDWKYNNNYVDRTDIYRHSKWLAMMERRLILSKELLRPDNGVLIATIDENEGNRLALLLEQVFEGYTISPVHIVHNPRGVQGDNFSFVHETAYFVVPKDKALIASRALTEEEIADGTSNLRNWGGESERLDAANCFYAIYVKDGEIVGYGDNVTHDDTVHPSHNEDMGDGVVAVWPVDGNGIERKWRYARQTVESIHHLLVATTLAGGPQRGEIEIKIAKEEQKQKTIWQAPKFDANKNGSQIVSALIGRDFPYPKSLYAVEDCLDLVVRDRPDAIVLDYFAGSGTTGHAVFRLNHADGGRRQAILVTNNEVAATTASRLRKDGHRPGDPEWEAEGICDSVTKPRIKAAITGLTPAGEPVEGSYSYSDVFPMAEGFEENVEFFTMVFNSPTAVSHNRAFASIAPMLWLRAGAQGRRIDSISTDLGWDVADNYGVLANLDNARHFLDRIAASDGVRTAFIVTDDDRRFQMVCAGLPSGVEAVRLYESYLLNFEINTGQAS